MLTHNDSLFSELVRDLYEAHVHKHLNGHLIGQATHVLLMAFGLVENHFLLLQK